MIAPGTRAEDQIELLVERARYHPLDLAEHAKHVEPFSSSTIETKDSARFLWGKVDHPSLLYTFGHRLPWRITGIAAKDSILYLEFVAFISWARA